MECSCNIQLNFKSEKEAKMALTILQNQTLNNKRSTVIRKTKDGKLTVDISAKDFTALRAMVTSTFRDMRVFIDAQSISK